MNIEYRIILEEGDRIIVTRFDALGMKVNHGSMDKQVACSDHSTMIEIEADEFRNSSGVVQRG